MTCDVWHTSNVQLCFLFQTTKVSTGYDHLTTCVYCPVWHLFSDVVIKDMNKRTKIRPGTVRYSQFTRPNHIIHKTPSPGCWSVSWIPTSLKVSTSDPTFRGQTGAGKRTYPTRSPITLIILFTNSGSCPSFFIVLRPWVEQLSTARSQTMTSAAGCWFEEPTENNGRTWCTNTVTYQIPIYSSVSCCVGWEVENRPKSWTST